MAAQPYVAATHMKMIFLTPTGPWDIGGSVSYAGTEIYPDPQYFAAQQASIERCVLGMYWITSCTFDHSLHPCVSCSYQAESVYHRQTSQHSVDDGEAVTTSDPPTLSSRKEVQMIHNSC